MLVEMYKQVDGQMLIVVGHLNKKEIRDLKADGYRMDMPNVNKNGIPIDRRAM